MFTQKDLAQLTSRNIEPARVEEQLEAFRTGFPYLTIDRAAVVADGIVKLDPEKAVEQAAMYGKSVCRLTVEKFVPASGAASRMFKDLYEYVGENKASTMIETVLSGLEKFAFYEDLAALNINMKDPKAVIGAIVEGDPAAGTGLGLGKKPKGLIKFHKYANGGRTAMEEHLAEGAMYARNEAGDVNVHFTVSHEHLPYFKQVVADKQAAYEKAYDVKYHISFSEQKPSTDTIAADMENKPFRDKGKLLFRPGGHGALIENLNDIDADVIFIKNIDNVVPDRIKPETVRFKKIIGGVLVSLKKQIDTYVAMLESGKYTMDDVREVILFLQQQLFTRHPDIKKMEDAELVVYLLKKLRRPLRVCGMVKNVGEPGGGPFLVYNEDGSFSPQILESSQIDLKNPDSKAMFDKSTHFNPVDLVCAVKNGKGEKYDLPQYVDKKTGFISYKSKNGKELKALELPGLWNGAMSDWNTLFVEVPISTFNPVKTVNDLLREQHQ